MSERAQVAYDRIMCEHMRNICISQQQLKFFTKRLTEEEIDELKMVLTEIDGGWQIVWVAESINKRRAYSESRRSNRTKKTSKNEKTYDKHILTYDKHMENEIENEIENEYKGGMGENLQPREYLATASGKHNLQFIHKNSNLPKSDFDHLVEQFILSREEDSTKQYKDQKQILAGLQKYINSASRNYHERKQRSNGKPTGDKLLEWYGES